MRDFIAHLRRVFRPEPTCEDVNHFLVEYVEGVLDSTTQARYKSHLERCPHCLPYFEQYKMTLQMMKADGPCEAPEQLVEHTLEFLRERIKST